ncbi:MAG: hypothetical protein GY839_07735 [candidate division Zixibacteria bacterium]|nr:hypothetical protein [candidate division Zixibacteria bacterium]
MVITLEQWSRVLRLDPANTLRILKYIRAEKIGDITPADLDNCNGPIAIMSRRMFRDNNEPSGNAELQLRLDLPVTQTPIENKRIENDELFGYLIRRSRLLGMHFIKLYLEFVTRYYNANKAKILEPGAGGDTDIVIDLYAATCFQHFVKGKVPYDEFRKLIDTYSFDRGKSRRGGPLNLMMNHRIDKCGLSQYELARYLANKKKTDCNK